MPRTAHRPDDHLLHIHIRRHPGPLGIFAPSEKECSVSFIIFMLGLAILIGGIAWGLVLAGVATKYIVITCLIVAGIGTMMAASRARAKNTQ
jgi:hypothetical protein